MPQRSFINRRTFLKGSLAAGAGLTIGVHLSALGRATAAVAPAGQTFAPNAWVRVGADGRMTLIVHKSEMGQGVLTSLPMLVAEELDVDLSKVHLEQAPVDPVYNRTGFGGGEMITGGSTSVRHSFEPLRRAGAAAREMLMAAAAETWGVSAASCTTANGVVSHRASGRSATYGELADKAARLPVPQHPKLKAPQTFTLIGRPVKRLDTPDKVRGRAIFGLDVTVPGMLIATVVRCPVIGGTAARFDASRAKAVPGVRHVVQIDSGVAVVADSFWAARQGQQALDVSWDEGANAALSSADISQLYAAAAQQPGVVVRHEGDAARALASAARTFEATYEVPYLAHAPMEPMNCTAHVRDEGCDIWGPIQAQTRAQQVAAKVTGLPPEAINVHTTLLGGGFGRRLDVDYVAEAVQISKALGTPVKLIWTREDDMQHGFFRPATYNVFRAGLDARGLPIAWAHRVVAPSIMARFRPSSIRDGIDPTSVEGAANLPYAIPNLHVDWVWKETGVPISPWRSVGSSQNAFITESFLDEIAAASGRDPYELRRQLLGNHPRHKAVLELAAAEAGWGTPLPQGRYRGIAVHESFGSVVAEVAEVSVSAAGAVRVHRVICAVDCGMLVNPDTVVAQMESGIVFGLTAALHGEITIDNGRVQQSNFHDYPLLRMTEMPVIDVHILPSTEAPGGVGEPSVPPIAPAVTNAIFAATGKRIRSLPISRHALGKA